MSIQWTFIAGYLYFEVAVVIVMILPIASPRKWNRFFKSRLFAMFRERAAFYFYVLLGFLGLFLIDAIREMRKYSHSADGGHVHVASEMKNSVKLFRAQRNFYITGFAIFLAFVIRRLVNMIIVQAELSRSMAEVLDRSEKIIKEAEASKNLAKTTVLAHQMQMSAGDAQDYEELKAQLELTEKLLKEEKNRALQLEEEVLVWKTKYQETCMNSPDKEDENKKSGAGDGQTTGDESSQDSKGESAAPDSSNTQPKTGVDQQKTTIAAIEKAAPAGKKAFSDEESGESGEQEEGSEEEESGDKSDGSVNKKTKRPPTDDEIKKYVKQILEGANLEVITMRIVYQQVYSHYPDFDLTHKKDFIRVTVKSLIQS